MACKPNNKQEFKATGLYSVSNSIGYEVQIDDCGEMARTRYTHHDGSQDVSEWREIVHQMDEDTGETISVISGGVGLGNDIPLDLVERVPDWWNVNKSMGD